MRTWEKKPSKPVSRQDKNPRTIISGEKSKSKIKENRISKERLNSRGQKEFRLPGTTKCRKSILTIE